MRVRSHPQVLYSKESERHQNRLKKKKETHVA